MTNERPSTVTRRVFVQRAAILLGSLITTACGAGQPTKGTPTPKPSLAPSVAPSTPPATPPAQTIEQTVHVNPRDANASDTNPGTESRPLKTIARAAGIAADNIARDIATTVILYPGTYREAIALEPRDPHANPPVRFQAKEPGTAIIAGSDVWTDWRRQGTTNIYTRGWPYTWGLAPYPAGWQGNIDLQPIVRRREMIFVNGKSLTQVLSSRALEGGTFFVDEQAATVSLAPPAGVDVGSATIEVAARSGLFVVNGARNITVRGIVFTHDSTPVGETAVIFNNCANVVVEDCAFLWNNWSGMTFQSTVPHSARSLIARRNIANHNGAIGLEASRVKDVLYEDNETSYNNWRGALGGFYTWSAAGMKHFAVHGGIYRRHRAVGNQASACWFDTDCADIAIEQAYCARNYGPGLYIEASEGPTSATDCIISQNGRQAGVYTEGGANVTLTGNIIYGNADAQIQVLKGIRPVKNWETNEALTLAAERWTLRKNVIVGTDAAPLLANIANSTRFFGTFIADENVWFSPKGNNAFDVDTTGVDFKNWRALSAQETNSRFIDPQFVDPERDDFTLRDGSPLRSR